MTQSEIWIIKVISTSGKQNASWVYNKLFIFWGNCIIYGNWRIKNICWRSGTNFREKHMEEFHAPIFTNS